MNMKSRIKQFLQSVLGFQTYLYLFANYIIYTLPFNRREGDFLVFLKLIKEDGLILDIGANIGIMTYHLSKKKPHSKIIAFEPAPENLSVLNKIVARKKLQNVEVKRFALGNENKEAEMVMPEVDHVKMQGLSHVVHEKLTDFNTGDTFPIEIKTIDSIPCLKDETAKLVAIKMDVENFESFVLEGARNTIDQHKPLIYTELWENENRYTCFSIMQDLGYETYVNEKGRMVKFDPKKHLTQNFFFLHQSHQLLLSDS
jgi:FkbM family methyltransferase